MDNLLLSSDLLCFYLVSYSQAWEKLVETKFPESGSPNLSQNELFEIATSSNIQTPRCLEKQSKAVFFNQSQGVWMDYETVVWMFYIASQLSLYLGENQANSDHIYNLHLSIDLLRFHLVYHS